MSEIIFFLKLGMKCRTEDDGTLHGKPLQTGPEQCICGCNYLNIPIEDECFANLCQEGEYCTWRPGDYIPECFPECLDLPLFNYDSCYCLGEVCESQTGGIVFCNKTKDIVTGGQQPQRGGCSTLEVCPQDYTIFKDGPICDCNGTIILVNISFCMDDVEFPLPTMVCPPLPGLAPPGQCICNNTLVCVEGLMCNDTSNTCEERPEPCPSLPEVSDPRGCYCEVGHEICEEGQTCGGRDKACYEPAKCLHPMFRQDWPDFLATNTTDVSLDDTNSAIETSIVGIQCNLHTFKEDLIEQSDTYVDKFDVSCSQDGNWNGLEKCKYPLCEKLEFDTTTVKQTLWGKEENNKVRHGSVVKLECVSPGHTFDNHGQESRFFYHCYKKKYNVTDQSLCQNQESCGAPSKVSCSFTGCSPLPKSFQERVVYDPVLPSYVSGSSLTVVCSNQEDSFSWIQAQNDPQQVLAVKKKNYVAVQQNDQNYCLNSECLQSAGHTWVGRDGSSGTDCIPENSDAFCIKSSKIKWSGSFLYIDGIQVNYN